jgi:hypothetical protein
MMDGMSEMMIGMGLIGLVSIVVLGLIVAALIKYLFFR